MLGADAMGHTPSRTRFLMMKEERSRKSVSSPSMQSNGLTRNPSSPSILPCCVVCAEPALSKVAPDTSKLDGLRWSISENRFDRGASQEGKASEVQMKTRQRNKWTSESKRKQTEQPKRQRGGSKRAGAAQFKQQTQRLSECQPDALVKEGHACGVD